MQKNSSETKKDTIDYLKSYSKGSEIYRSFKLFHKPKLSSSVNHGDRHFKKLSSYAPALHWPFKYFVT